MSERADVMESTAHLIITVHGIRTYGRWQARLKTFLLADIRWDSESGRNHVLSYRYGVFTLLSFLVPFLRNLAVAQFRRYLEAIYDAHPCATVDIVAHSFGTYLVLEALANEYLSPGLRVRNVIFCGSAARPNRDLSRLVGPGRRISRLVNDCGTRDGILLLTFFVFGVGMAGRIGFQGFEGYTVWNRYHVLGHSGYFERKKERIPYDGFMQRWWIPLLLAGVDVLDRDRRPIAPSFYDRLVRVLGENGSRVTVAIYVALLGMAVSPPIYLWKEKTKAEFQAAQIERGRATLYAAAQARLAATALQENDRATAIKLALEALLHQDKHAFIPEAYKVLYDAAYVDDAKERVLDLEGAESTWTFSSEQGDAVTFTKGGNINVWSAEAGVVFRKSSGTVLSQVSSTPSGDAMFMDGALGPGLLRFRTRERQLDEINVISTRKRPHQFVALSSQAVAACDFGKSLYELKIASSGSATATTSWDVQLPIEGNCTSLVKGSDDQLIVGTSHGEILWFDTVRKEVVRSRKVTAPKFTSIRELYVVKDVVIASLFGRYVVFKGEQKEAVLDVDAGIGYERPFVTPDGLTVVSLDTREVMKPLLRSTDLVDMSTKVVECSLCKIVSISADGRLILWRGEDLNLEAWETKNLQRLTVLAAVGREVDRFEYVPWQSSFIAYRSGSPAFLHRIKVARFTNTFSSAKDDRNTVTNIAFLDRDSVAVGLVTASTGAVSALGSVTIEWTGEAWKKVGEMPFNGGEWIHVLPFEAGSVGLFSPSGFFNAELGIFSPGHLKIFDKSNRNLGDVESTSFPIVDYISGYAIIKTEDSFRAFDFRNQNWIDVKSGVGDDVPWDFRAGKLVWSEDSTIYIASVGAQGQPVRINLLDGSARQICLSRNGQSIFALLENNNSADAPAVYLRSFSVQAAKVDASIKLDLSKEETAKVYEDIELGLLTNPGGVRWATSCESDFVKLSTESGEKRLTWSKARQEVLVEDMPGSLAEKPLEAQKLTVRQSGERVIVTATASGKTIFESPKLKSALSTFTISRDAEWVAVGTEDGTIRVWLLSDSSSPCIELRAHNGKVKTLLFNPSDTWLASVGDDGYVRAWPTPSASILAKLFHEKAVIRN